MKVDVGSRYVAVTLSRRNLLVLLAKLDGHPAGSAATIHIKSGEVTLVVSAEEDAVHYKDREPGEMHPDTERALRPR